MISTTINANIPDSLKRTAEGTLDENVHKRARADASSQKVDAFVKSIDLSFLFPTKCTFSLDLNKIEPQTNKTYKTLIEEQSASQTPYTISLVNDRGNDNFYDFDAKSSFTELKGNATHPVTKNKIRSIYLFTIGSLSEEFKYLGVVKRMDGKKKQPFLQAINKALSGNPEGFYELALGKLTKKSTEKDLAEAIELLMIAARGKSTDAFKKLEQLAKEVNTQAKQNLAICHQYGFGTEVSQLAAYSIIANTVGYRNEAINASSQKVNELIKNIDLSFLFPSNCTLLFDLNKIEPLTNKTYKTLIEERRLLDHQTPYIISLVNDVRDDRFYDLDGQSILPKLQENGTHPLTKKKIRSIYLFTINSLSEDFNYLGVLKRDEIGGQKKQVFLQAVTEYASGDPEGFYQLALIKLKKLRNKKANIADAVDLLMLAAKEMSTDAFKHLEKLGSAGNMRAALNTAICYQYGYGTEVDHPKAMNLFTRLAKENDTEAFHNILASASQGDRITQAAINFCLEKEKTVQTGPEKSLKRKQGKSAKEIESISIPQVQNPININEPNLTATANIQDDFLKAAQGDVEAFKSLQRHADSGDSHAQYSLGHCEEHGYATPISLENAMYWYAEAAKQKHSQAFSVLHTFAKGGNAFAQNETAFCLINDLATLNKNRGYQRQIAYDFYLKSATSGNAEGQYNTGYCLEHQIGVTANIEEAIVWYIKSALSNNQKAYNALVKLAESGKVNAQKYIESCKQNDHDKISAEEVQSTSGQDETVTQLAMRSIMSQVKQGDEEAFDALLKLAKSGNADAQYFTALCQQYGCGAPASLEKALYWYAKAAKQRHQEAFSVLHTFAKGGNAFAQNETAFCLINDLATLNKNRGYQRQIAYDFYLKSATSGNAEGQYNTGYCLEHKFGGVAPNIDEAIVWYIKSALSNNQKAHDALLRLAKSGKTKAQKYVESCHQIEVHANENAVISPSINKNQPVITPNVHIDSGKNKLIQEDKEAIDALHKPAEYRNNDAETLAANGNADAQYFIGKCEHNGYGTSISLENALQWYAKAARQGHQDAFNTLLALAKKGHPYAQIEAAFCLSNNLDHNDWSPRWKQKIAHELYFKLANGGNAEAQFKEGQSLESGSRGSLEIAIKWYTLSASSGNQEAQNALARIAEAKRNQASKVIDPAQISIESSMSKAMQDNKEAFDTRQKIVRNNAQPATNKTIEAYFDKAEQGDPYGFMALGNLAINDNNAHAQYFYGLCLQNGYSSTPSPENAIQFYGKAAKQGHSEAFDLLLGFAEKDFATAQNEVAFCKVKGLVTPLDLKGAYSLTLQSATSGNARGQYTLGCYLENGICTEANIDDALLWYLKSAKAGERAAFEAIERLAKNKNVKALEYLSSSKDLGRQSEDNHPNIIDQINQHGKIENPANYGPLSINELEMNKAIQGDKEGFKVLLNRAEKGNPRAQFYVGICYEKAYGTAYSLENAMQWYVKAAELEHSDALKHLLLFADKGCAFAQNKAAYCKLKGLGCISDKKVALHLYSLSAKSGDAEGLYRYGYCLEEGFGIESNHDHAVLLYANAAYQNHPEAFKALSRFAEKRHVKAQNYLRQIQQMKYNSFKLNI